MSRFRRPDRLRSDWVPLGEATRILGVSAGTLRRWSDDGQVPVFVTPGGHRRFNRPSLERLLPGEPTLAPRVRSALTPARLARAYRREATSAARQLPWLVALTDDQRQWFRSHGRGMAELLLGHLDADDEISASHALKEGVAEASSYGRMAAELGLSLSQALEGFLQFRRPFLHELSVAAQRRGMDQTAMTSLTEKADRALDRLIVAAIAAQSVRRLGVGRRRGGSHLLSDGSRLELVTPDGPPDAPNR